MSKHTPGPWRHVIAKLPVDGAFDYAIRDADGELIAEVFGRTSTTNYPPAEANARLMAAAPELLAALVGILEIGKRDMSNQKYDGYFDSARAAVAKAEGREL